MGIQDFFSDLVQAAMPWSTVDAEAPASESKDDASAPDTDGQNKGKGEADEGGKAEVEDKDDEDEKEQEETEEGEEEEEEEEEDDEDEPKDPKETLEEDCIKSKRCSEYKHHYDACGDRVSNGSKEDCVEEFFHLTHCATQCAAPRLWSKLK